MGRRRRRMVGQVRGSSHGRGEWPSAYATPPYATPYTNSTDPGSRRSAAAQSNDDLDTTNLALNRRFHLPINLAKPLGRLPRLPVGHGSVDPRLLLRGEGVASPTPGQP